MHYIFLQLKTTGRGINDRSKGAVWSTSFVPADWKRCPGDSLEKFCEREQVEIVKEVKTYGELRKWMIKLHNHFNKLCTHKDKHGHYGALPPGVNKLDAVREFFNAKKKS